MIQGSTDWRKTTCGEAKKMSAKGVMIWWRPNGVFNPANPDGDLAYYAAS